MPEQRSGKRKSWWTADATDAQKDRRRRLRIGLTYSPTEMLNGYAYIKRVRDLEKGQVFMAHDAEGFKAHKQSPEYYE